MHPSQALGPWSRVQGESEGFCGSVGPKIRILEQRLTSVGRSDLKGEKETPQTCVGNDAQTKALVAFPKE